MLNLLKRLFNVKERVDLHSLVNHGALLIDVRTVEEFEEGHVPASVNIPLDSLGSQMNKLDKTKPIVAVCRSGRRSGIAVKMLKKNGFEQVYNGGAWQNLLEK